VNFAPEREVANHTPMTGHRMKARLGELQARLDSHERQRAQHVGQGGHEMAQGAPGMPMTFSPHITAVNGHPDISGFAGYNSVMLAGHGGETSASRLGNDQQGPPMSMMSNLYDQPADEYAPSFFPQSTPFLNSPPKSHPSPRARTGLPSPGRSDSEQSSRVSQDFVLDCLRFQTQALNRLNTLQPETQCQDQGPYVQKEGYSPCMCTKAPDQTTYVSACVLTWRSDGRVEPGPKSLHGHLYAVSH
jgi:hypothetical protein